MPINHVFLLVVLCFLVAACGAFHTHCNTKQTLRYHYKSMVNTFGSHPEDLYTDGKQESGSAQISLQATVYLTCLRQIKHSHADKTAHLYSMQMSQVKLLDSQGLELDNLDEKFNHPTAFSISRNGKVFHMYHKRKEEEFVTVIKKSIIDQIQTKFHGKLYRIEKGMEGKRRVHYTKTFDSNTSHVLVQKTSNQNDIIKLSQSDVQQIPQDELVSKLQINQVFDSVNGHLLSSIKHHTFAFGSPQGDDLQSYQRLKQNIHYEKGEHVKIGNMLKADGYSQLTLQTILSVQGNQTETLQWLLRRGVLNQATVVAKNKFYALPSVKKQAKKTQLLLNRKEQRAAASSHSVHQISSKEWRELLQQLEQDPFHLPLLAKMTDAVVELSPQDSIIGDLYKNQLHHVATYTNVTDLDRQVTFLKVLQTLVAAMDTSFASQQLLAMIQQAMQVMKFDKDIGNQLTVHGFLKTIELTRPSTKVVQFLKQHWESDATHPELKNIIYQCYCSIANRIRNKSQKVNIRRMILNQLLQSSNRDELISHIIAMANAGTAIPLPLIRGIVMKRRVDPIIRILLVDSLSQRREVGNKSHSKVSKLIYEILRSRGLSPRVKEAAVKAQMKRENDFPHVKTHLLVPFVKAYLSRSHPKPVHISLEEYLQQHKSKSAAKALAFRKSSKDFTFDDEDVQTLISWKSIKKGVSKVGKSIGKGVKSAGKSIANGAKKVGKGVVNGAKKVGSTVAKGAKAVGKGVKKVVDKIAAVGKKFGETFKKLKREFSAAKFAQNNKQCYKVGQSNMCLYDTEMNAFVSRYTNTFSQAQFGKAFAFEKLVGAKLFHLYVGAMGLITSNLDCQNDQFEALILGRANIHGNLFGRRVNMLTAYIDFYFLDGQFQSNTAYLNAFGFQVKKSVAERVNTLCSEGARKNLYEKSFNNLPRLQFYFPIVIGTIKVSIGMSASVGVDAANYVCIPKVTAALEPVIEVGVNAQATFSILIAEAGIEVQATLNYKIVPSVGVNQCKVCALLDHEVSPFKLEANLIARVLSKKWKKNLFTLTPG